MRIAVIGANGFVGKNLVKILKTKHKIIKISRKTKFTSFNKDFDLSIHSANSSKKYEASSFPLRDFKNSVKLTKKIINHFGNKKIILISTISASNEKNIYSKNRKLCENLILKKNKNNIIFRLSVLLNFNSKRGILYDLIKGKKIYLDKNVLINPLTIEEVAKYILMNIKSKQRVHEIGSVDKFKLSYIKNIIGSKSKFGTKKIKLTSKKNPLVKFNSQKLIDQMKNKIF
jgi:dTDP-4-dehydrorhamnose reductase